MRDFQIGLYNSMKIPNQSASESQHLDLAWNYVAIKIHYDVALLISQNPYRLA